jgi:murein DD-endopeptidase MepM/ murein hydrolase activator NlpD
MMHYNRKLILLTCLTLLLILTGFLYYDQTTSAYNIVVEGEVVGQVEDVKKFHEALNDFKNDKEIEIGRSVKEATVVSIERTRRDENLIEAPDKLVETKVVLNTEAYSVLVNGKVLFSVIDKETAERFLDDYKLRFNDVIDENANIESIEFKDNVTIQKQDVEIDDINSPEEAEKILYTMREQPLTVTVEKGDTLWDLSREFKTTVEDIGVLNNNLDVDRIKPGDVIIMQPGQPLLDVVTTFTNTIEEEIPYETEYQQDNKMLSSERKVIKKGSNGKKLVDYRIDLVNGLQQSVEVLNEEILEEPVRQVIKVGTMKTLVRGSKRNYGIIQGKRVSSGYGSRIHPISGKRTFHEGVDIAATHGNGVYAYASGTVTFAGWSGGYGQVVFINHGNGLETRYAHLSKINVKKGQKVTVGQKIGAVGSTGYSTGPHVHFEVRKNGSTRNPWDYI